MLGTNNAEHAQGDSQQAAETTVPQRGCKGDPEAHSIMLL